MSDQSQGAGPPPPIQPYTISRACQPQVDARDLQLTTIDATQSVYTRVLLELAGASLPVTVYNGDEQFIASNVAAASPGYILFDYKQSGSGAPPPPVVTPPSPPPPPPSHTSPGSTGAAPTVEIVYWDLYASLKYRQDWKSAGYGIGDLLYTVSLLPNEQVTLELKTWETSKTQQDSEDSTDSRNVSDIKSTNTTSAETAMEDHTKTHEYMDAKASYSGFGASADVSGGWSKDVDTMNKQVHNQAQENSNQSTSEYRQTHQVKISLSRETGSEDKTTRKLQNLNQEHTLNANYFELLHEYSVTLTLYNLCMTVLGAEPDLGAPTPYVSWWSDTAQPITLGQLIRYTGIPGWIDDFVNRYGISPIKVLRELWSAPLYYAAPSKVDWTAPDAVVTGDSRADFRATLLRYVQPSPGWVEPDSSGALRWGYEVRTGHESDLLQFLYQYVPTSIGETVARALAAKMDPAQAPVAAVNKFRESLVPDTKTAVASQRFSLPPIATVSQLAVAQVSTLLGPGQFHGTQLLDFSTKVDSVVATIASEWAAAQQLIGSTSSWMTVLPTHGVYADLALGICSGAEDYIAVQRQFDLELKKLDIEKAKLELARLALENQILLSGKPLSSLTIQNPVSGTTIDLNLGMPTEPTTVAFETSGTSSPTSTGA
jgi:hypothetical protein